MKAMIFAAGMGTRLKPLTDFCPKALIPVSGKPMLAHVITKLKSVGVTEMVINVHHLAEQIIDYLNLHHQFDLTIHISDEREVLLETGGGLQKAAPFFQYDKESFLVHNADILSNFDLSTLMDYHNQHASLATLLVSSRKTNRYLLFDEKNRLRGWVNKQTGETKPTGFIYQEGKYREYAYAGIQAIHPRIYAYLPEGKYSIIDFYLSVCNQLNIQGYNANGLRLLDIGKQDTLAAAEQFIKEL